MKKKYVIQVPVELYGNQIYTTFQITKNNKVYPLKVLFDNYDNHWQCAGELTTEEYTYQKAMFENSDNILLEVQITIDHNKEKIAIAKRMKLKNMNKDFAGGCFDYKFYSQSDAALFKSAIKNNLILLRPKKETIPSPIEDIEYIVKAIDLNNQITEYKTYISIYKTHKEPFDF